MAEEKGKIGRFAEFLDLAERALHWWPIVIGTIGTGGFAGWAAHATNWLNDYGPITWVMCAIFGSILFMFFYWLWAASRLWTAKAAYTREITTRPHSINPLQAHFEKQKINVSDFFSPFNIVNKGKSFNGCRIHGPGAIALLNGCALRGNGFMACDLVLVTSEPLLAVTAFEDTTFSDGEFFHLTIFINQHTADLFLEDAKKSGASMPTIIGLHVP